MKTFYGIADAHGVESFIPEAEALEKLSIIFMRAQFNRQRHACFYKAECSEAKANVINGLIVKGNYGLALCVLKTAKVAVHEDHQKSWGMIPNPSLDPWA